MLSLPVRRTDRWLWLMWLMGFNNSIASVVSFIALTGVAAETGVVMLIYLDQACQMARANRAAVSALCTSADLAAAIEAGAVDSSGPKL